MFVELAWSATSDCRHLRACETRLVGAVSKSKSLRVQPACTKALKRGEL